MKRILGFVRPEQWANADEVREHVIAEKASVVPAALADAIGRECLRYSFDFLDRRSRSSPHAVTM